MSDGGPPADADADADQDEEAADPADDASSIRALDDRTVRQIAAGEVVERPASVVKELVENSLDADADRVSVAVERGGTEGVRVRDDGVGMTEREVRLAVEEHTTSKIRDIDDLEAGVGTLGFRGEALHTIGAVSRLTVRSKPRDGAADAGTELTVEGGDVTEVRPAGCPEGTVVEVEDLFYNTPARRKFLKTEATEFDHVNTVVTQYALANPDVAVSLEHDGREVFATEGRGSLESTVLSVYGREVAESMLPVEFEAADGPVESVSGLVSHPETTRAGREYLSTFVNDRYVSSSALREGVLDAYGGQLAPDRYPFAVLFVDVPPSAVDVNVHPRKMEVRFDDESGVESAVESAVRESLLSEGLVRSSAPRGRSAPAETAVSPSSYDDPAAAGTDGTAAADDAESDARVGRGETTADADSPDNGSPDAASTGVSGGSGAPNASKASSASAHSAGADGDGDAAGRTRRPTPRGRDGTNSASTDGSDVESAVRRPTPDGPASDGRPDESVSEGDGGDGAGGGTQSSLGADGSEGESGAASAETEAEADADSAAGRPRGFRGPTTQRTLDGDDATPAPEFDSLPSMRVLGQLHDTYVVAETPDGLVLVDQHAADERVNYERLREAVSGDTPTQALAEPVELELTAREAALFDEYRDALAQVGFHAGRTGERTVEVRSVPAVFDAALDPGLLRDALSAFVADREEGGRETVDAVADSLLADLACYPSITGNTSLREGSVVDLLEALDDCENPYACPHGRPVVVEVGEGEIADRFERDYPGHAGRREE